MKYAIACTQHDRNLPDKGSVLQESRINEQLIHSASQGKTVGWLLLQYDAQCAISIDAFRHPVAT